MTLPGNERVGKPVAERVMSTMGSSGGWSVFKVVSMAEEVVSTVVPVAEWSVPVAEGAASPPDRVGSEVGG